MEFILSDVHRNDGSVWKRVSVPRKISLVQIETIKQWCTDHFGPVCRGYYRDYPEKRWTMSLDERSNLFFKHPEDVTLFLLRWA